MNWHSVTSRLLTESKRAFEEARLLTEPQSPMPVDPMITMHHLHQAMLKSVEGDILRSLALAINEGLKNG